MTKSYSEMIRFDTFEERFRYLQLHGRVSELTFGQNRHLNQMLYKDPEWRSFRNEIILRDDACDLACPDRPIVRLANDNRHRSDLLIVHHINPITVVDVINRSKKVFDPENVICCKHKTHNGIHYGDDTVIRNSTYAERYENDTIPWR